MAPDNDKRNFALRTSDGEEKSVFSGSTPRQAALKAARRLDPAGSEDSADRQQIRLREKGTHKVHVYEGWAWKESPPDVDMDEWDAEDPSEVWMNQVDDITKAHVSKQGIEHLEPSGEIGRTVDIGTHRRGRSFDRRGRESATQKDPEMHVTKKSDIPDEVREILEEETEQNGTLPKTLNDLTREEISVLLKKTNTPGITENHQIYQIAMSFYDQEMEINQYSTEDILNLKRISKFAENSDLDQLGEMADEHIERYFKNANFDPGIISRASNPKGKLSIDEAQRRLENRIETLSAATENYELSDEETEQKIVDSLSDQYLRMLLKAI